MDNQLAGVMHTCASMLARQVCVSATTRWADGYGRSGIRTRTGLLPHDFKS